MITFSKGILESHERAVHEEISILVDNVSLKAPKRSLAKHRRVVNEGMKYAYGQLWYQATAHGSLDQPKREVHEEIKYKLGLSRAELSKASLFGSYNS